MHQPQSKQPQLKILQQKRPRIHQTPKMVEMIGLESLSFSQTLIVVLETPLSQNSVPLMVDLIMVMEILSKRCNNMTMIVLITVVAMTEAIVDTKVAETMVAVAIIITDAMITEATAVNGAKTTNMEMIAAAVDMAAGLALCEAAT